MSAEEWANRIREQGHAAAIEAAHDLAESSNAADDYNYTAQRHAWADAAAEGLLAELGGGDTSRPTTTGWPVDGAMPSSTPSSTAIVSSA